MPQNQKPCPCCGGTDIKYTPSTCLCSDRHRNPCWSYPQCRRCGYTNYSSGANSEGTSWGSFTGTPASTAMTAQREANIAAYEAGERKFDIPDEDDDEDNNEYPG